MNSIFVSYKFRETDRVIAADVKRLITSHLLTPVDGEDLGGEQLWEEVRRRILSADALVALFLSPHDADEHAWLRTEYDRACDDKQKKAIAIVETTYPWRDPRNKEYIKLDRATPLPAFLKLSTTLGVWRRDAGQRVQIVAALAVMILRMWGICVEVTSVYSPIAGMPCAMHPRGVNGSSASKISAPTFLPRKGWSRPWTVWISWFIPARCWAWWGNRAAARA